MNSLAILGQPPVLLPHILTITEALRRFAYGASPQKKHFHTFVHTPFDGSTLSSDRRFVYGISDSLVTRSLFRLAIATNPQ
jgi:hypothetical protein